MNYKELIIKIKKDESTIKNLVKNIKNEVQKTESFDDAHEERMKIMQNEYTEAHMRINEIMKIYETDHSNAESN